MKPFVQNYAQLQKIDLPDEIFVDTDAKSGPLRARLLKNYITQVKLREDVNFFVVHNPAKPHPLTLFAAVVGGGRIAVPAFVKSYGLQGCSITYKPAVQSQRLLWISKAFCKLHPKAFRILRAILLRPRSRWGLLPSKAVFLEQVDKNTRGPKRTQRPFQAMGLVTKNQRATESLMNIRSCFDFRGFVQFCLRETLDDSTFGFCGH